MTEKVTRLRPKRHDAICKALQLWLDLPGLKQETRDDLSEALGRYAKPETWWFVMLNPEQQRLVLRAINRSERPLSTLKIWNAAISHIRYDTGEVMASRDALAEDAETSPMEASRALNRLVEIGALLRLSRGRFAINPYVGWAGSLAKREEAIGKKQLGLRLVEES